MDRENLKCDRDRDSLVFAFKRDDFSVVCFIKLPTSSYFLLPTFALPSHKGATPENLIKKDSTSKDTIEINKDMQMDNSFKKSIAHTE